MIKRDLFPGMGQAVGERTYLRYFLTDEEKSKFNGIVRINPNEEPANYQRWNAASLNAGLQVEITEDAPLFNRPPDSYYEVWEDVAKRVAEGNCMLPGGSDEERQKMYELMTSGGLLMSGRHLQHGDTDQPNRNMEVFTNCSTSATPWATFYLLLNGSGVGTSYDDDLMLIDWDQSPSLRVVLDESHGDFDYSHHESLRDARHKYRGKKVRWVDVEDSREGWAKAFEIYCIMAYEKKSDWTLVLNFTKVRGKNTPIKGMQNRPASGPAPLMDALVKVSSIKGAGMDRWMQAMYVDHYMAECVLVGGARRASRIATKYWKDKGIFDFVDIKRPIEYGDMPVGDVIEFRNGLPFPLNSFLWSANNSVAIDDEFVELVKLKRGEDGFDSHWARHARKLKKLMLARGYGDGTGEPGSLNVSKLTHNYDGLADMVSKDYVGYKKYMPEPESHYMYFKIGQILLKKSYTQIVNPCAEISLMLAAGYCTIADIAPYNLHPRNKSDGTWCPNAYDLTVEEKDYWDSKFIESVKMATRALIRVNQMPALYSKEVKRTNRIGVGLTGVHEYAWARFGLTFQDLLDENRSIEFWDLLKTASNAVVQESIQYSKQLGVVTPHTALTIKPSGTVSKLFGLTEGWHLPSMLYYVRWVQFRSDDPLIDTYRQSGYPVKELVSYSGTTIVGFPTQTILGYIMPPEMITTAAQATMEQQYQWLKLGEKYWINGGGHDKGNQISYTMKYDPEQVSYKGFCDTWTNNQFDVRCCSVMPQTKGVAYEYQPEEPVTKGAYDQIAGKIVRELSEEVDKTHLDCENGACPIEFNEVKA